MSLTAGKDEVAVSGKSAVESWDHLLKGGNDCVKDEVACYLPALYAAVDDVEPSSIDFTKLYRANADWQFDIASSGYRAVVTVTLLMVISSIRTGESEWLENQALWSLFGMFDEMEDAYEYGDDFNDVCDTILKVLRERIDEARSRKVPFVSRPFEGGVEPADDRWSGIVGQWCKWSGCEVLETVYEMATGIKCEDIMLK